MAVKNKIQLELKKKMIGIVKEQFDALKKKDQEQLKKLLSSKKKLELAKVQAKHLEDGESPDTLPVELEESVKTSIYKDATFEHRSTQFKGLAKTTVTALSLLTARVVAKTLVKAVKKP